MSFVIVIAFAVVHCAANVETKTGLASDENKVVEKRKLKKNKYQAVLELHRPCLLFMFFFLLCSDMMCIHAAFSIKFVFACVVCDCAGQGQEETIVE